MAAPGDVTSVPPSISWREKITENYSKLREWTVTSLHAEKYDLLAIKGEDEPTWLKVIKVAFSILVGMIAVPLAGLVRLVVNVYHGASSKISEIRDAHFRKSPKVDQQEDPESSGDDSLVNVDVKGKQE